MLVRRYPVRLLRSTDPIRFVKGLAIAGFFATAGFFSLALLSPSAPIETRQNEAREDVTDLTAALRAYFIEYQAFPTGDAAAIVASLRGENPRKITFLETNPNRINATGEFFDPWGTPYRIDLTNPRGMRVWSCGRNCRDEGGAKGSDDIASWRPNR